LRASKLEAPGCNSAFHSVNKWLQFFSFKHIQYKQESKHYKNRKHKVNQLQALQIRRWKASNVWGVEQGLWEKFYQGVWKPIPGPLSFWSPCRNLCSLLV